jgi:hypothetical protein
MPGGMIETSVNAGSTQVVLQTMVDVVKQLGDSNRVSGPLLKKARERIEEKFNAFMAVEASRPGDPGNVLHVFEWGGKGPLWKINMTGSGNTRVVTYELLKSTTNVPIRPEFQQYNFKRYKFTDKAAIFEDDTPVVIRPYEKYLVYIEDNQVPSGFKSELGGQYKDAAGTTFSTMPSEIVNPGGGRYKNSFDTHFLEFWGSTAGAEAEYDELAYILTHSTAFRAEAALRDIKLSSFSKVMSPAEIESAAAGKATMITNSVIADIVSGLRL